MEGAAACEIERLPEDLLSAIISFASPRDACRAAAVSRAFLAAADSDAVWSRFLPRDLPRFVDAAERSLMALPSYKARFMRLSDDPALLLGRVTRMWVDRATGGKCYALSARALNISWGDDPRYWRWIHLDVLHDIKTGKRIASEAARLLNVAWLEIHGRIDSKMLSANSTYGAYLVFRLDPWAHGLGFLFQEGLVTVGGSVSIRRACLHGYNEDGAGGVVPRKYVDDITTQYWTGESHTVLVEDDVAVPRRRVDGWMELELADGFYNHQDGDGEVCVALNETKHLYPKGGLIVRSIEFRIKQKGVWS